MSFKAFSLTLCLLLSMTASLNLEPDVNNPLLVSPPTTSQTNGAQVIIRFSFPSATANAIGPSANGSNGLTYKQFLGVAFPPSLGSSDLQFDQTSSAKWSCDLTDGTNTYTVKAIQPVASLIVTTLTAESNIAYCRLDEAVNVPLKTGPGIVYKLTISLSSSIKISSNFLRSVSLFTSTSNNPEKMIIDSIPVLGTVALYGDYSLYNPKALDIANAVVSVTSGPSASATNPSTTVYPYNTFDVTLTLKSTTFITAADHMIVFKYPSDTVSAATSITTYEAAVSDPLQAALKGNLSPKTFGTDGFYLDGVGEDLIPGRQFKLTLKGWKSLDTNISSSQPITVIVYYKNTYSVLSYATNNVFFVTQSSVTVTANHPEFWDVYRSGAWPIAMTFQTVTDLTNGGWVVIQQSNTVEQTATAGNKITFIPSTCDFTGNDSSIDSSYGKRSNCYPLRTIDTAYTTTPSPYNGSGFFFQIKGTISSSKTYKVTIWAFFDVCGGSNAASLNNYGGAAYVTPKFTVNIYKTILPTALNENRFINFPTGVKQSTLATSAATEFSGKCWNNIIYANEAAINEGWTDTATTGITGSSKATITDPSVVGASIATVGPTAGVTTYKVVTDKTTGAVAVAGAGNSIYTVTDCTTGVYNTVTAAGAAGQLAAIHYQEISDWIMFSETLDTGVTGSNWYLAGTLDLTTAAVGQKFIYTTTNGNLYIPSSYFVVGYKIPASAAGTPRIYLKTALPVLGDGTAQPGKWYWQFPSAWFTTGKGYKTTTAVTNPTCYASWGIWNTTPTSFTGNSLIQAVAANGKAAYDPTHKNFIGASVSGTPATSTIDSSLSLLPPDDNLTGAANILRIVSTYWSAAETRWRIADYTTTIADTTNNAGVLPLNVAFFTSCVTWKSTLPTITSLYTYIDVQIKWNYIPTGGTTTALGNTTSNIRLIKLFPETGVFQDFNKNPTAASTPAIPTSNPYISHTIYNASQDSICLLEFSGSIIAGQKDTGSDTLVVWIFFGTLLETDYNDVGATYPVAPLASGINVYGLQTGAPMDVLSSTWFNISAGATAGTVFTPILYQFTQNNASSMTNAAVNTALPTMFSSSNYMWFMGSVLYFTSVSSSKLTSNTDEVPFFVPYYCPRWISAFSTGASVIKAHLFPLVMATWITSRGFNSVTSVNTWINYRDPTSSLADAAKPTYKLLGNKADLTTNSVHFLARKAAWAASATVTNATLRWSPYTTTSASDVNLYVYNGTNATAGVSTGCTGHSLFLASNITVDTAATFTVGYTGAIGYYPGTKTFYALGKPFTKAIFYGIGSTIFTTLAAVTTVPTIAASTLADPTTTVYFSGVKRLTIDNFVSSNGDLVLTDRVAYSCVNLAYDTNQGLSNYVVSIANGAKVSNFILDWNKNVSGATAAWATPSMNWDKTDVAKLDVAANFKVTLSPPQAVPAGTLLKFTANNSAITGNTICGLVLGEDKIVVECETASPTISCKVPTQGTSFQVCCYNISVTGDNLSLATVLAYFPFDKTIAGISPYLTTEVYNASTQIGGSTNPFSFVTNNLTNTDIIGGKNASIQAVNYSQVNQESGIGKVTFTINLPREPTRDMKLSVVGEMGSLYVNGNIPRCLASFTKDNFGSSWDSGDVLIDSCSVNNLQSGGTPIVITTKRMLYKCGKTFQKTIYVSLWPVLVVNWTTTTNNKSFKVQMTLNSNEIIALNTSSADLLLLTPVSAIKPLVTAQWDTLCAVSSISPRIPGELADYQFDIDLDTSKTALANSNPNEVTIFFPYQYYGSFIPNVLCYSATAMLNCSFTDEGILNIRFSSNITVGSGKKIPITIVGVRNPGIDGDYSFPCTVNNTNFSTGARVNLITGSGKLTGGITTASVTAQGNLKFLQVSTPVTDKNPRNISVHKFRIAFDTAIGLTGSSITIANTPVIHVYFPSNYKLAWYASTKASAIIDEYTSSDTNAITKTSTISPASITQSGNRITITLTQPSYTFSSTFRYWDITISNIVNPADTTSQTSIAPFTQTTRPFYITLTNSNLTSLYRTNTNVNTYASDALTVPVDATNPNLGYNRGNSFTFDNSKWVVDIYAFATQLNLLTIKAGRFLQAYFNIKANSSNALTPYITTLSLTDSTFKTSLVNYTLSTSISQALGFYIGCQCGTAPGYYLVNFSSSDTTYFSALSPVVITVDTSTKAVISTTSPPSIPAGGSVTISIVLTEPNFDVLNVNWVAGDNAKNDDSAKITNVVIPSGTVTPITPSTGQMSPVYSVFSITSSSTTLSPQSFKTSDPNACYTWSSNTLTFTISGQTAIIPSSLNLATYFKYTNADTDTTIPAKNAIKFNFTAPAAPIYLYCALACINMAYPADADIQVPKVANTNYLQFYSNIVSSTTPIDIVFSNLVRGMQYHMRCIIQSTQGDTTLRTSSSVNIENYVITGTTNSTTVNIQPSNPQPTQCVQWQFLSEPGQQTRTAVVNYCQKLFSANGYMNSGCVICTYSDMSYVSPGLTLPTNITCPTTTVAKRLRFLQSTNVNPPNVTADVTTTLTVCPIAHSVCTSDVSGNKVYADIFNQLISDLKTAALFKSTLNIDNVRLNTTVPTITVTDTNIPDITKLVYSVTSSAANGAFSSTAQYASPLVCFWQISDSATAPAFSALQGCSDASWCGKSKVGVTATAISTTNLKAFTAGSTYNVYLGCTNDIPMAQKQSAVKSMGTFTIPAAAVTPTPDNTTSTVTPTTSASFTSFSALVVMLLALLFI